MVHNNRKTQHFANFILPTKGCKIALRVIDKPGSRSLTSWIFGEVTSVIKYKARCVIIESRFPKGETKKKIGVRKDTLQFSMFGRSSPKVWYVLTKAEEETKFTPLPEGDDVKEVKMKDVLAEKEVVNSLMLMSSDELSSDEDDDKDEDKDGEMEVQNDEDVDVDEAKDGEDAPSKDKKKEKKKEKKEKKRKAKTSEVAPGKLKKPEEQPGEPDQPEAPKEDPIHTCLTCEADFKESEMLPPPDFPDKWMCSVCSNHATDP